jgi:hypothetical protein
MFSPVRPPQFGELLTVTSKPLQAFPCGDNRQRSGVVHLFGAAGANNVACGVARASGALRLLTARAWDASLSATNTGSEITGNKREVAMPKASTKTVTTKAKREAIAKAYGCHPVEADMDDFYYGRRHLAKLPHANQRGWRELRYQDEGADLADI